MSGKNFWDMKNNTDTAFSGLGAGSLLKTKTQVEL